MTECGTGISFYSTSYITDVLFEQLVGSVPHFIEVMPDVISTCSLVWTVGIVHRSDTEGDPFQSEINFEKR